MSTQYTDEGPLKVYVAHRRGGIHRWSCVTLSSVSTEMGDCFSRSKGFMRVRLDQLSFVIVVNILFFW